MVTTATGEQFADRSVAARRKHLSKTWTNHEWLSRLFALIAFLAQGRDSIRLGGPQPDTETVISVQPLTFMAPYGINEDALGIASDVEDDETGPIPNDDHEHEDDDG
jgi:hypothetical protein